MKSHQDQEFQTLRVKCMCVGVYLQLYVLGGKGKLAEPLRQVVHSSNTNGVKFLSCHRKKDSDSPLSFSQTT